MKIIEPSHAIETPIHGEHGRNIVRLIERAARTCYKSECKITPESASPFVRKITQVIKHESVIEHSFVSVRFICDRGVTHELCRHRLAAFSQESTRYCNYSKDQFGNEITVIRPFFFQQGTEDYEDWKSACEEAEARYFRLIQRKRSPQEARGVLPTCLKTEIVVSTNCREWRHILKLRAANGSHPQIVQLMRPLLAEFKRDLPELFEDIHPEIPVATAHPVTN